MRLLVLRLGQILARFGVALQAAALKGAGIVPPERKPPQRPTEIAVPGGTETPAAVKPKNWRMPSADELDAARGEASAHGLPRVKVCRGPGKGCNRGWHDQTDCPDCYFIHWHDRRPSAQIIEAMERGDA